MAQKYKITINRGTKNRKYFHGMDLNTPSKEECDKYNKLWDIYNTKGKYNHEEILDEAFLNRYTSHNDVFGMYVKCVLLDKFYSTNVKYIDKLVEHYINLETTKATETTEYNSYFEEQIKSDKSDKFKFVDELKEVKITEDEIKNLLSFSSKYCRRYAPLDFPIYDTIVKDVLKYYLNRTNFYEGEPPKNWEKDYVQYKQVVDKFIEKYKFIQDYVMLDKYLWSLGKQKKTGINMIKDLRSCDKKEIKKVKKKLGIDEDRKITIEELEDIVIERYELN